MMFAFRIFFRQSAVGTNCVYSDTVRRELRFMHRYESVREIDRLFDSCVKVMKHYNYMEHVKRSQAITKEISRLYLLNDLVSGGR